MISINICARRSLGRGTVESGDGALYFFECSHCLALDLTTTIITVTRTFSVFERTSRQFELGFLEISRERSPKKIRSASAHSFCHTSFSIMSRLRQNLLLDDQEEWEAADEDSDDGEVGDTNFEKTEPNLPERGILPKSKAILINRIDKHNGLSSINRKTRLLDIICDSKKDWLGGKDSDLRKRVRVVVSHWKRNKQLYEKARSSASKFPLTTEDLVDDPLEEEDNPPSEQPAPPVERPAPVRLTTTAPTSTNSKNTRTMQTPPPRSTRGSSAFGGSPSSSMFSPRDVPVRTYLSLLLALSLKTLSNQNLFLLLYYQSQVKSTTSSICRRRISLATSL